MESSNVGNTDDYNTKEEESSVSETDDLETVEIRKREKSVNNSTNRETNSNVDSSEHNTFFECNICYDVVNEPVLTLCGHLYCWPCIFRWLEEHPTCPVCKAGTSRDKLIPIYGRNSQGECSKSDPTKKIPQRPKGQRTEPEPTQSHQNFRRQNLFGFDGFRYRRGGFSVSTGLFGFHYQPWIDPIHASNNNQHPNFEQMPQAIISRILLTLGAMILLFLFLF